jgi:hypothetical protein
MFWRHPKRNSDRDQSSLSVGQRFDLAESATDVFYRAIGGSPLNMFTLVAASLDIGISSANARRGNAGGAAVSAMGAQASGIAGWFGGEAAGSVIGSFILPGVGTYLGGVAGGAIGALTGDKLGRTATQHLFNAVNETRPRVRFGGFRDSEPAYTMRQRAEQELGGSLLNARRYLGREAQLMHQ